MKTSGQLRLAPSAGKVYSPSIMKYICINCGYIYDPDAGDPVGGVPPGTPFEDLPEDWTCPICYVSKDNFDPLD